MSYNQSKWLYDILQEHGFDVCVDAFKQNISVLERKDDLDKFVKYHLKRLSITTVNRQDYLQGEIRKCENLMMKSMDQAHDDMFCTAYNVDDIVYNYVAAEALRAKLLAENEACCGRELQNAQHARYMQIAAMLGDINNDNVVDDIVEYVRSEVENYGELIGGKGFIDYVLKHLHEGTELSIWARGSKWLDEKRIGNVFERLALLRLEQFEADKERPLLKQKQAASKPQHKIAIPEQTEPSTERAKKYFQKAVESGYMEKTTTGYKWIRNCRGKKAQLSYFLMKVYNPDNSQQIPFKALEALFDVTRLDSSYSAMLTVSKPQIWRQQIDNLFEE